MKYIAIRKEPNGSLYMDKNFFSRFTDADLPSYKFTKVQAPEDCITSDFNEDLTFSEEKYNHRKNAVKLQEEQKQLNDWFKEYDNQVKQYQRCIRLGIEYDKDIVELDNQAKINQERIREIKNILKV